KDEAQAFPALVLGARHFQHRLREVERGDVVAEIVDEPRHLARAAGKLQHAQRLRAQRVAYRLLPCPRLRPRRDEMAEGEIEGLRALRPVGADIFLQVEIAGVRRRRSHFPYPLRSRISTKRFFARSGTSAAGNEAGRSESPTRMTITMPMP